MIPNMPTVGVRFDIGKMDAGSHAVDAWQAFWQAVDPVTIRGSLLFDGDADGNVFWIVVQNMDGGLVKHTEAAVSACDDVRKVCAEPLLAKGAEATSQQLEPAWRCARRGRPPSPRPPPAPSPSRSSRGASRARPPSAVTPRVRH